MYCHQETNMKQYKFRKTTLFIGVIDFILVVSIFSLCTLAATMPLWCPHKTTDRKGSYNFVTSREENAIMRELYDQKRVHGYLTWIIIGILAFITFLGALAAMVLVLSGNKRGSPTEARKMTGLWMMVNLPTIATYIILPFIHIFYVYILLCIPIRGVFMFIVWRYRVHLKDENTGNNCGGMQEQIERSQEFSQRFGEIRKKPFWHLRKEYRDLIRHPGPEDLSKFGR